jgi:hypothetical protein
MRLSAATRMSGPTSAISRGKSEVTRHPEPHDLQARREINRDALQLSQHLCVRFDGARDHTKDPTPATTGSRARGRPRAEKLCDFAVWWTAKWPHFSGTRATYPPERTLAAAGESGAASLARSR